MPVNKPDLRSNGTIERQHVQIEALLDALWSRFETEERATRKLVSLMNSLAAHLETHFELEEENEHFGFVLQRAPHLSEHVDQLLQHHASLKMEVDALAKMAAQVLVEGSDMTELSARFLQFRKWLLDHEKAEVCLLQEAYTRDLGGGD